MFNENKIIIKNFIYEYNEKLDIYIKIRKKNNEKNINEIKKSLEKSKNTNIYEDTKICENIKTNINISKVNENILNNEITNEKEISDHIINSLLNNLTNNNFLIISFNENENKNININISDDKKTEIDEINSYNLHYLIECIFFKINDILIKSNEKIDWSIKYSILTSSKIKDLLGEYEKENNLKTLKSCTLKDYKNVINKNVKSKNELENLNNTIKHINFSNVEELNDILKFAMKQKKKNTLNLKKRNDFYICTLIILETVTKKNLIINKKNNIIKKNMIPKDKIINKFYFFSVSNIISNNKSNNKDELKKINDEIKYLIKYCSEKTFKVINLSDYSMIGKIIYEMCIISMKILLKTTLNIPEDYKEKEGNIINFLCNIDVKLKEQLYNFIKNINEKAKPINDIISNNYQKKNIIKNEKYYILEKKLFENVDIDEETKNNIIKEAMNIPEELFDYLDSVKKNIQCNYEYYKEAENEVNEEILYLINKQNEIIKNYKDEENITKKEIDKIYDEICDINEQISNIKKEMERCNLLHLQHQQKEEKEEEINLKKIDTHYDMLSQEYKSYLKFKNESTVERTELNENIDNNTQIIEKSEIKNNYQNTQNIKNIQNTNKESKLINELNKQYETEFLNNFDEAKKYAENLFHQTYDLKNKFNDIINEKIKLFNLLKYTALKLNEKTNSLITNFKNDSELKLIHPIEYNFTNCINKSKKDLSNYTLNEYNNLLKEFKKNNFTENQLHWINKIYSLSKKF